MKVCLRDNEPDAEVNVNYCFMVPPGFSELSHCLSEWNKYRFSEKSVEIEELFKYGHTIRMNGFSGFHPATEQLNSTLTLFQCIFH